MNFLEGEGSTAALGGAWLQESRIIRRRRPTTKRRGQGNPPQHDFGIEARAGNGCRSRIDRQRSSIRFETSLAHSDRVGRAALHTERAADAAILIFENRRVVFQIDLSPNCDARNSATSAVCCRSERGTKFKQSVGSIDTSAAKNTAGPSNTGVTPQSRQREASRIASSARGTFPPARLVRAIARPAIALTAPRVESVHNRVHADSDRAE